MRNSARDVGPLSARRIRELLEVYDSPLPRRIATDIQKYMELLALWSKKVNLTAIQDPEEIVRLHFGESIFAFSLGVPQYGRLADVGTGAGFPGVALKLAAPEISIILIEPNKKKCAFLHEMVRKLDLRGVHIIPEQFERAGIPEKSIDAITCRALGIDKSLLEWSRRTLATGGSLFLWLGGEDSRKVSEIGGWKWEASRRIPGGRERNIIKGRPE